MFKFTQTLAVAALVAASADAVKILEDILEIVDGIDTITNGINSIGEEPDSATCWPKATSRTAGSLPDSCPAGTERDLAVCYEESQSGYTRAPGSGIYTEDCPSGFTDALLTCAKPSYYPSCSIWSGCSSCKSGYVKSWNGRCYKSCPSGMSDNYSGGCTRDTYTRWSEPLQCDDSTVNEGGVCYRPCENGAAEGPLCWGQCPPGTEACGKICLDKGETCDDYTEETTEATFELAIDAAGQNYFGVAIHAFELSE